MKNLLKILGGGIVFLVIIMAVMVFMNICPPQGPWPQPPWCPGSSISWPFTKASDPPVVGVEPETEIGISEDERLALVAIGLVQDLTTVNTYFNDAASSIAQVQAFFPADSQSLVCSSPGKTMAPRLPGSNLLQGPGEIPTGFLDPLPESGYIPAPAGACAVGASPSASFLNEKGEKIDAALLAAKDINVIGFEDLTGGSIEGNQLEGTLASLITPGDQDLMSAAGWNEKVWNKMMEAQNPASSLMDYHLWSVSSQIERAVVESMLARMETMGLPPQVINAYTASRTSGWYASPTPEDADRIAAMEIEAVFSGKTEGTIYEQRDFSLPILGEMPVFGPMSGEGSVVYHDPDSGDYPFDLEIDWTKWDALGRVTEGEIVFTDPEHDVMIELSVRDDNSRTAHVYRHGNRVGIVNVDTGGRITYEEVSE